MGECRFEAEVRDLLARHGKPVRETRHGTFYDLPGGERVLVSGGEHDRKHATRFWLNARAELRRKLRAAGVAVGEPDDDEMEDEAVETQKTTAPEATRERLSALGIHVERRRRVVEIETAEATVDHNGLAALLGLIDPNLKAEGLRTEVRVIDVDEKTVEGPFVVRVRVETERFVDGRPA